MAIAIDIQSKFNLDINDAQQKMQTLSQSLANNPIAPPFSMNESQVEDLETSNTGSQSVEESKKSVSLLSSIYDFLQNRSVFNKDSQPLTYNGVNNAVSNVSNTARQVMTGNFIGAAQGNISNVGHNLQNVSTNMSEKGTGGLAGMLGGLGTAGVITGALVGILGLGANKVLAEYEKNLPSVEDFYRGYGGDITGRSRKTNSMMAQALFKSNADYVKGTGLSNADFFAEASEYAKYGFSNANLAAMATRSAANIANVTGADFNQIQRIQGLNYRFNGVDGSSTVDQIYNQAAKNGITIDDLQKYMPELIANIEMAMETGIDSGFTKSVSDVADTVSFISNLSQEEVWKKNAGSTYKTMASGLANAVNLSSTTDIIAYQALSGIDAKSILKDSYTGNTYLDRAMMLENGPTAPLVRAIHKQMGNVYGGDMMENVMAYKELYGLNTKGAVTLYKALETGGDDEVINSKIKTITSDSQYQSDSKAMTDSLNNINSILSDAGRTMFEAKLWSTDLQGDLSKIIGLLSEEGYNKIAKEFSPKLFNSRNAANDKDAKKKFESEMEKMLSHGNTVSQATEILNLISGLDEGQLAYLDSVDFFNDQDYSDPDKILADLSALNTKGVPSYKFQHPNTLLEGERTITEARERKDQKAENFVVTALSSATVENNQDLNIMESYRNSSSTLKVGDELFLKFSEMVDRLKNIDNNTREIQQR